MCSTVVSIKIENWNETIFVCVYVDVITSRLRVQHERIEKISRENVYSNGRQRRVNKEHFVPIFVGVVHFSTCRPAICLPTPRCWWFFVFFVWRTDAFVYYCSGRLCSGVWIFEREMECTVQNEHECFEDKPNQMKNESKIFTNATSYTVRNHTKVIKYTCGRSIVVQLRASICYSSRTSYNKLNLQSFVFVSLFLSLTQSQPFFD